ncbi:MULTISPECIES: LytR/AlgR family response regulator transcription factor [Shewanella]|jgi:two-component system LytT family response regulator|uniref:LytTR family DNA-binding domain-containing protein n=1 Tax=Shewanella vaxholmensis TaxID=3063535 RepID=A0ABU9UP15_9GAMM|nr:MULTISPECIES: LytTR family DNA-binding domain-containing protein [Shewanella]EHC07559.1 two component transcriptional regulator, LytTR family [Shewanella baltica OS625]EHQ17117.1 two component transcriptional regulator, LytTR family [Shewanella baltica OS183]KZK71251.1 DNA-binding response regulator [Shewanella baltica]MCI2962510.1 LytTR family DNA-binding domain-containing protein [Shewanella sp. N2AIL]MCS6096663.1 response regulator transcription factor [Shewanella baltica]
MLKAIIVEDEYLAREELEYLVKSHSEIDIVASFEDGLEAFKYLQDHEVDVVFLDIQIPSIDGLLLAKNLHKSTHPPHVVFVTAYKEFAVEAFELEAFDYILKPYNEPRIISLLQKIEQAGRQAPKPQHEAASNASRTVNLVKGERIIVTPCEQIYYAEADEKLTYVYTRTDRYVMQMTISEFVSRLPAEGFFRCHRSYCVNINKIREIVPWFNSTYLIRLHDLSFEVPVSRSNIKAFRQLMRL